MKYLFLSIAIGLVACQSSVKDEIHLISGEAQGITTLSTLAKLKKT